MSSRARVAEDQHVGAQRESLVQLHRVRGELDRMAAMKGSQLRMMLTRRAASNR